MGALVAQGEPWEPPASAAEEDYAKLPVSTGSAFPSLLAENPFARLGRLSDVAQAQEAADPGAAQREAYRQAGLDPDLAAPAPPPAPKLDPDEANKQFAPPGEKLFKEPVAANVASVMGKQRADQIQRDSTLSRWSENTALPIRLGASFAAGLLDPINDAAAFVPGIGEEALLARLGEGAIARTVARAGAGAASGAVAMVPIAGVEYGLSRAEQSDYSMRDALYELAMGAAVGAMAHAGFGAAGDWWRRGRPAEAPAPSPDIPIEGRAAARAVAEAPAAVTSDAIRSGVAQIADGRPLDVTPFFDRRIPATLADEQANLYRNGYAPGIPQTDFDELNDAIYGEKGEPSDSETEKVPAPERAKVEPTATTEAEATRIGASIEGGPSRYPDAFELAKGGNLTPESLEGLSDQAKQDTLDRQNAALGENADQWRKLQRQSDAAWNSGYRDLEAREFDRQQGEIEEALTPQQMKLLESADQIPDHRDFTSLARDLRQADESEDRVHVVSKYLKDIPNFPDLDKLSRSGRDAVAVLDYAMKAEEAEGGSAAQLLNEAFGQRHSAYGGGADADELVRGKMADVAKLLGQAAGERPAQSAAEITFRGETYSGATKLDAIQAAHAATGVDLERISNEVTPETTAAGVDAFYAALRAARDDAMVPSKATADAGLHSVSRTTRARVKSQPETLLAFLKRIGGVRDDGGELSARDLTRGYPGLVNNKRGLHLDEAREAAAEAGFLGGDTAAAMRDTTIRDLLDAVENHPSYSIHDIPEVLRRRDVAAHKEYQRRVEEAGRQIDAHVAEFGEKPLDPEWRSTAAEIYLTDHESNLDGAIEAAAVQLYERDAEQAHGHREPPEFPEFDHEAAALDQQDRDPGDESAWYGDRPGTDDDAGTAQEPIRQTGETGGEQGRTEGGRPAAGGERADPELAAAEQRLAEIGGHLTAQERAELDAGTEAIQAASSRAEGFAQAGECLKGAGI